MISMSNRSRAALLGGLILAAVAFALPWSAGAQEQQPAQSEFELETVLRALEAAAENPALLQQALQEQIRKAHEDRESIERQLRALDERLNRLSKTGDLLKRLSGEDAPEESSTEAEPSRELEKSVEVEKSHESDETAIPEQAEFTDDVKAAFAARFREQVWPLLTQGETTCLDCHGAKASNPLELPEDSGEAFLHLLQKKYFDPENPSSLLAKLMAPDEDVRMPPKPRQAWDEARVQVIRGFVNDLFKARGGADDRADERFPEALLTAYEGAAPENAGQDNTFLTYYQLKRKVKAVFGDDWVRNERDLFNENIALFSGADFQIRFNESAKPTAEYLTGLDLLANDVASRAYLIRSGPFADWKAPEHPPVFMNAPDEAYREAIAALYRRILFREPTPEEMASSFEFIRNVYKTHDGAKDGDSRLEFEVTVQGETGPPTARNFAIQLRNKQLGLYQERIDQNAGAPGFVTRKRIGESFPFKAGDEQQTFSLTSADTTGTVAFAGIEIVGPLPSRFTRTIHADSPIVRRSGPWRIENRRGMLGMNDANQNKGECTVEIPIKVQADGDYEVHVRWSKPPKRDLAGNVLVQVYSPGPTRIVNEPLPERPPKGEAHFIVDQTLDTIAFWDLKTSFKFENEEHYVEINNTGTTKRVTADAVNFVPQSGERFLIDNDEAEGKEDWPVFTEYPFRPYNITGRDTLNDQIKRKGEIQLRYKPAKKKEWSKDEFYNVQVGFPGQANNDTRVPVIVKAAASSPIVRLAYPSELPAGAEAKLDASASYDVQHGELKYEWRQVGGPVVEIDDPHSAAPTIRTRLRTAEQGAWEGLARALIRHPDFVFTRPVSLAIAPDQSTKRQLQLVKIAQDLVARPPNAEEIKKLADGASLGELIDDYLASEEFREFYFRRIRLYLESHGSDEEDEATRLWCYVAFNDRPFQEIITADYTVNDALEKIDRPAYYGRTGILTMKGFIQGKPGLPHFNYAAQVAEKFLGYVFEVPPEIVEQREGITAAATTSPGSACYSCHKVLTPLAYQRMHWTDAGEFRIHDTRGLPIDASDQGLVATYPYKGNGMEAFALSAAKKERYIRTIINTHFNFYFGREMRWETDERGLYHRLWNAAHEQNFAIRALIKSIMLTPEYLGEEPPRTPQPREVAKHGSP